MKNIDFLPDRYREQAAAASANWWRLVVVGLFGSGIGLASLCQYTLQRSVNAELSVANLQYEEAQALELRLASAQEDSQVTGREAELHAYLQHPWPRTQVLGELAAHVPEPVVLKNVRLGRDGNSESPRPVMAQTTPAAEQVQTDLTKLSPAERDLRRLRDEYDERRLVIEVEGTTADMAALHGYVAQLARSSLFERAELVSLEGGSKETRRGAENNSSFRLRVLVKFGYGQTHGPTAPTANALFPSTPAKG